jgi:hypothetical protein
MNGRRELEERLGAMGAPHPPAGLAQRIKGEIPKDLLSAMDVERLRLRRGVNLSVRIAIAVVALLLLIWLAFAVLDVREHEERPHNPPAQGKATIGGPVLVSSSGAAAHPRRAKRRRST